MKRRQFFTGTMAGLLGILALKSGGVLAAMTREIGRRQDRLSEEIEGLFSDIDSAKVVGQRYLTLHSEHDNVNNLLSAEGLNSKTLPTWNRKAFSQRRQEDFLLGNTVILDGWILARSEVCLCVVLVLSR